MQIIVGVHFFFFFFLFSFPLSASILFRGNQVEPATLDPHQIQSYYEGNIVQDLFTGLCTCGEDGEVIPGIAHSWEVSDDGLTYTFFLRESFWSNGDPLLAEDFVYSFRRLLNPHTAAPHAFLLENIRNGSRIIEQKERDLSQLGVIALDSHTVQILLDKPTPCLPQILATPQCSPVHRGTIETCGKQWTRAEHWISNGPFTLQQWVMNEKIFIQKNLHFYAADQVSLEGVAYYSFSDQTEWRMSRAGRLDVTMTIPVEEITSHKRQKSDQLVLDRMLSTSYLAFNTRFFPLQKTKKIRRALSLAIDRELLIKKILGGEGVPLYHFIPDGFSSYHSPSLSWEKMSQKERESLAQQYLRESIEENEWSGMQLPIEIIYPLDVKTRLLMTALSWMWKSVLGIDVQPIGEEWKVYLSRRSSHNFVMEFTKWLADYDDPHTFFTLFYSKNHGVNTIEYSSEKYDRYFESAEGNLSSSEREHFFQEAEKILLEEDSVIIPLYQRFDFHFVQPHIKGWKSNCEGNHLSRYLSKERG